MTKKLLSIAALTALLSTGASAFDMDKTGKIFADITKKNPVAAKYSNGVKADTNLTLSTDRRGDTLIYPAYRSGDGWSTEISVRNTREVAIIAKAVVYAKDNSRELGDFNLYLSPHDVAKFTLKDGKVTSTDGSIAFEVRDPIHGAAKDAVHFANETDRIFTLPIAADAGYVIIYAMAQQEQTADKSKNNVYHNNHTKLFKDYRKMLDECRQTTWRDIFTVERRLSSKVLNGTAVSDLTAPNLADTCENAIVDNHKISANFVSPTQTALFGEVSMSHGGEDKRSLLLPATALQNYTDDGIMMLWAEGEYASIQDRRIDNDKYIPSKIKDDAQTFMVNNAYFSFDKNADKCKNDYAFLLTQPMKRALVMGLGDDAYWKATNPRKDVWGFFTINDKKPWTEDEGSPVAQENLGFVSLNSPLDGVPPEKESGFRQELATFTYAEMLEGADSIGTTNYGFETGAIAGYVDMRLNAAKNGIPAIVTQMTSNEVEGEAQINWIYSATSNDAE